MNFRDERRFLPLPSTGRGIKGEGWAGSLIHLHFLPAFNVELDVRKNLPHTQVFLEASLILLDIKAQHTAATKVFYP
jgi:hypothetical protein